MKSKSKGLQNLTDSQNKINQLLTKKKLGREDLQDLDNDDLRLLLSTFTTKLNELKGEAFDEFYEKIESLAPTETKNQIWERNHNHMTWAISTLMQDYGRMPTVAEIANKSSLSRQTINKHLKEYKTDPRFIEINEQFRFMSEKVLARVYKFAVNGDMRAAKLYFEVIGDVRSKFQSGATNTTQNNFIQVNQIKISQQTIEKLEPQQLSEIEALIKTLIPNGSDQQ